MSTVHVALGEYDRIDCVTLIRIREIARVFQLLLLAKLQNLETRDLDHHGSHLVR